MRRVSRTKRYAEMRDYIGRKRVGADDEQRKRPSSPALYLRRPIKRREEKEAEAAAEERPRRRPDSFDDRTDPAKMQQQSSRDQDAAGREQTTDYNRGRLHGAHPPARRQPEQHCPERRDKAEG